MSATVSEVWATEADLPSSCDLSQIAPDTLARAQLFASDVMYNRTRRRWPGHARDRLRPWRGNCDIVPSSKALILPAAPIVSIDEVTIAGDPFTLWELRDRNRLWRTDYNVWPYPEVDPTFLPERGLEIAYTWGVRPPASFVTACALLAFHYALAWTPGCEGECRLPSSVISATRNGLTTRNLDWTTALEKGLVGLREVDQLIGMLEMGEKNKSARLVVPGQHRRHTRKLLP